MLATWKWLSGAIAMHTSLVWFKRDLRTDDHLPLFRAAARGKVLALYVYEDELIEQPESHACHYRFVAESLHELREAIRSLGGTLWVRRGALPDVFHHLRKQIPFDAIYSHEETGNARTYARDKRVKAWCRTANVQWHEFPQHGVFRPHFSREGWANRWTERMRAPLTPAVERLDDATRDFRIDLGDIQTPLTLGLAPADMKDVQLGGARQGLFFLRSFLKERGETYATSMSSPRSAWDGCSRLSPHLAYGTLSLKRVYQATRARRAHLLDIRMPARRKNWSRSLEAFESRLYWHCHFMQKLEDEPRIEFERLATQCPDPREEASFDEAAFSAWCRGETGFPMVDACMRMLLATGWLNFRMRALLVSFAAYHLWLPWQRPALHLARHFLDFEPGIHYPQVQMQAGTTGINTLRIYNPSKQARDQDPEGDFIRRWVPELQNVDTAYIHEPQTIPPLLQHATGCVIGKHYPAPIVDEKKAAERARKILYGQRQTEASQIEAEQIAWMHGSRRRNLQGMRRPR